MEALPPPPDGNVSRACVVSIPTVITAIIAVVLTILRLYVRMSILKRLDWDDFFNVLAALGTVAVMGLTLGATSSGLGRHLYYLDKARAAHSVKLLRICEFLLILTTVTIGVAIWRRLLLVQHKDSLADEKGSTSLKSQPWKIFLWTFIAFNTITSLLDAAIIFPQCTPVELNWDHSVQGHCWSNSAINATGIVQGTIASATDFILSTIPVLFLWNIQIKMRVKIGIAGLMMLGFSSGAFAVARTVLVPSLTVTHDPTWDLVDLFLWANLEATFGVIAAAAPSVRPLFGRNAFSSASGKQSMPSIPLHTNRRSLHPGRSWYRGMDPEEGDFETLKESPGPSNDDPTETPSEVANNKIPLWENPEGKILKTTDVRVSRDAHAVSTLGVSPPEVQGPYHAFDPEPPKAAHL